jgi:DNA replication protein DnaC
VNAHPVALEEATIRQQCKALHMPTIAVQCSRLAEQAVKERQPYLCYLEALLSAELDERERNVVQRRIREAHLPRLKTLEDFDFAQCPKVSAVQVHELAEGKRIF